MHAELLGHAADHGLRLGGAVHPHRTLTQLQRVFPRCGHRQSSSHESHLTCCHTSPHLGGSSEAKEDLTAFADFPHQHWKKIQSTNPLERLNREIKRRTDVVQVFLNPTAVLRLATAVLAELHDEWIAFPRRYLSNESMDALYTDDTIVLPAASDE
jgi:hypothetical protein